jgi:hypothetical protein
LYPNGWLKAELTVTKTTVIDYETVPSEITFTQYKTRSVGQDEMRPDDLDRIANIPIRSPNDVVPVEHAVITITNIQPDSPSSSYIPMILDKTALIDDKRFVEMGVVRVASSGKWWMARELYKSRETSAKPHREVIVILLLIASPFSIILLIRMAIVRKIKTVRK